MRVGPFQTKHQIGLSGISRVVKTRWLTTQPLVARAGTMFDACARTTELIVGERKIRAYLPSIRQLRVRVGQQDDRTTDPQYFIATNTLKERRVAAVLIRLNDELEACVLLYELRRHRIGLGILRLGDYVGESLIISPEEFRAQYVHLAAQALLHHRTFHGLSLTQKASLADCIQLMGPENKYRTFSERSTAHLLPLEKTYEEMLAAMGPRTRRSLAGKRRQLEMSKNIVFSPSLEPAQALEVMLALQPTSLPNRATRFYQARYRLLLENPEFFSMGISLPDGTWLSILSGWRRNRVTYVDLQMNDVHFKKESISAVMRAFMLEHEIACRQELINFVGGCSLLLRRYCQPVEVCTDVFLWRPCLRATLFRLMTPREKLRSIYERVESPLGG
jgi:hypothetical protein